jgi:hypothetical protein
MQIPFYIKKVQINIEIIINICCDFMVIWLYGDMVYLYRQLQALLAY